MDDKNIFESVADEVKAEVHARCTEKMLGPEFNIKICSVCDRIVPENMALMKAITDRFVSVCRQRLNSIGLSLSNCLIQY